MKNQPICHFLSDCFAYSSGHCKCLNDTNFKGGCPFYKNKKQHEQEIKEITKG